jgi:hypothetical protein
MLHLVDRFADETFAEPAGPSKGAALRESGSGPTLPIRDVRNSVAIEGEADIVREVQFGSD